MPDEPNGRPSPQGGDASSEETQHLGPDLTKHVPVQPSPNDATPPWSDPAPPPSVPTQQPPYGQPYAQQGYPQQPYPQ